MKQRIKNYITINCPFGPISADEIKSPDIAKLLFDKENRIYRELEKRPSFILGRKGSGKTAFLANMNLEDYKIIVEMKAWRAFSIVLREIQELSTSSFFVESIADIWEMLVWNLVIYEINLSKLVDSGDDFKIINKYISSLGKMSRNTPERFVSTIADLINKNCRNKGDDVTACAIEQLTFNDDISFTNAKVAAENILNTAKTKAIVLIDSMEDFSINQEIVANALGGLFKCIWRLNIPESICEIRFCFPSELWHVLREYSRNPHKDFAHRVVLNWHAGELLSIAAHRLGLYLNLYESDFYDEQKISSLNFDDRKDAQKLFSLVFPDELTNRLGYTERVIAYLFRHTQLLPRQLFSLLNSVFLKNRRLSIERNKISEEAIRTGIYDAEETITDEIFQAFHFTYPNSKVICQRCIPEMPLVFPANYLHKLFNRHAKKEMPGKDFEDFKQMLLEIGCVGRVIDSTNKYIIGEFEYTVPHRLVVSTSEELCLHPLFCGVFSANKPNTIGKAIYPHGSDTDGIDYRDF